MIQNIGAEYRWRIDGGRLAVTAATSTSTDFPDELKGRDAGRQQQSDYEHDEDAADVGDRQRVGIFLAFLVNITQPATVLLAPPSVEQRMQCLVFL